jgi:hypothetical protein
MLNLSVYTLKGSVISEITLPFVLIIITLKINNQEKNNNNFYLICCKDIINKYYSNKLFC